MNIVINTSNLNSGGALQVAYSVIYEFTIIGSNHKFLILTSPQVNDQICKIKFSDNFELKLIDQSPASIKTRSKIVNNLDEHVEEFKGNTVLTIFGPSYWTPKVYHVSGFADGWCYNPKSIAYSQLDFIEKIKRKLLSKYKLFHLKRSSNSIFVETEDAKSKLASILNNSNLPISAISNTYSHIYDEVKEFKSSTLRKVESNVNSNFLLLSTNYPNKNIKILNKIIPILKEKMPLINFFVTISNEDYKNIITKDSMEYVTNLKSLSVTECIEAYKNVDFLFLPTLLETFTATYPEAMIMKKPILTSDLSFARDICGDAAIYFDPLNPEDISNKIIDLVHNKSKIDELIRLGEIRVKNFPSAEDRAKEILKLCIINK